MTSVALHPAPRWRDIAFEQFRAVGLLTRVAGALVLSVLVIYSVGAIRVAETSPRWTNFAFSPEVSIVLTYVGLFLPALIWHNENPSHRTYHLAMPISRSAHALTKAFAGWVWLMLVTLVFLVFVVATDVITKRIMGASIAPDLSIPVWEWLVPFTSASIAYALSSSAAIGAETPAVWIVGPAVVYAGAGMVIGTFGATGLSRSMLSLFSGYLGAAASMAGRVTVLNAEGTHLVPSISRWAGATLLWGAAAGVLLYAVSRRRAVTKV